MEPERSGTACRLKGGVVGGSALPPDGCAGSGEHAAEVASDTHRRPRSDASAVNSPLHMDRSRPSRWGSKALRGRPRVRRTVRRAVRLSLIWAALGNLLLVCGVTVLLRTVGEGWWLSALLTYSPRLLLALPLLIVVPALVWFGPRPLLWTQLITFLVWLFPLMGFHWSFQSPAAIGPSFRLLTYNVGLMRGGPRPLCRAIIAEDADVVVLQEASGRRQARLVNCLSAAYPEVHARAEFLIASRFNVRTLDDVEGFVYRGERWTPRAARYELETPLGSLALYSVHPGSPREAISALRRSGLRKQLRRENLFGGYAARLARVNVEVRELQFAAALKQAAAEPGLVVVAGDTNLPGLSPVIAEHTRRFQDGFVEVGRGFGYTYPSRAAFVRIDRVFADRRLAFNSLAVSCGEVSDHHCVVSDLSLRPVEERLQ